MPGQNSKSSPSKNISGLTKREKGDKNIKKSPLSGLMKEAKDYNRKKGKNGATFFEDLL
jgi:hypothetical protein